jgi:hypothetical protein
MGDAFIAAKQLDASVEGIDMFLGYVEKSRFLEHVSADMTRKSGFLFMFPRMWHSKFHVLCLS